MDVARKIDPLLTKFDVQPVLVDVGASGGAPTIWQPISRHSVYVGFDPDLREIRKDTEGGYRVGIIVNKAVCAEAAAEAVTFHLTESPYCSSMLQPDNVSLAHYSFWKLFEVTRTTSVPATTLAKVMEEQGLAQIDWLKIDAQGTDLRIYRSLEDDVRKRIVAVDTEPGLLDAYCDEDLFVDVHKQLRSEGFWLSNLNVMGVPRISRATMEALGVPTTNGLPKLRAGRLRSSPGWCEARYLRSTEWLKNTDCGEREFILAWVFAVLDGQFGYALDIARVLRKDLGRQDLGDWLWRDALELLGTSKGAAASDAPKLRVRALNRIRRTMHNIFTR